MKLRYDVTTEDHVAFSRHHYRSSPAVRHTWLVHRCVGAALLLVLGIFLSRQPASVLPAALLAVLYFLVTPYFFARSAERQARRMLSEGTNKGVLEEHELEVTQSGLVERTTTSEQRSAWEAIERIETDGLRTFIYIGALAAHVVPKAAVKEGDYEAFMRAVRQRLAAREAPGGAGQARTA